jgi:multiple sugar transport system permease protein
MTATVTDRPHRTTTPVRRDTRPRRYPIGKVLLTGLAWLIGVFFLAPYLVMFTTALKPAGELGASPATFFPVHWDWSNFLDVWSWQGHAVLTSLQVTLVIAGASTLIVVLVSIPAAYYTARHTFRGRTPFLLLVLVTQMFAPTALVVGLYREFLQLNLVNSYLALILVNAGFNLAFSIWILQGYFTSIPVELEEAAMLDGLGRFGSMMRVTLPLAMPGIVTAVIFTFIAAWNEFVVALTLTTTPDHQPLTVTLDRFIGAYHIDWQFLFAGSIFAVVPVVVLFALIERYLVGGLTAGSVK